MTQSFTNETQYFDLHTRGLGYLNRAREVKVRNAEPYMAVTVVALHGAADDVEYTYIDCRVTGAEADMLIRHCKEEINSENKVLVHFTIGDIWVSPFTYQKGDKKGQPGASLKGRLLYLSLIKINGETVFRVPPKDAAQDAKPNTVIDNSARAVSESLLKAKHPGVFPAVLTYLLTYLRETTIPSGLALLLHSVQRFTR